MSQDTNEPKNLLAAIAECKYVADLSFENLRRANIMRLPTFKNAKGEPAHTEHLGRDWTPGEWMTAAVGELGEAANIMKKVRRGDYALDDKPAEFKGSTVREALAKEFADVVTYLDILAMQYDVDLGRAVLEKFNEISKRVDSPIRIGTETGKAINVDTGANW